MEIGGVNGLILLEWSWMIDLDFVFFENIDKIVELCICFFNCFEWMWFLYFLYGRIYWNFFGSCWFFWWNDGVICMFDDNLF